VISSSITVCSGIGLIDAELFLLMIQGTEDKIAVLLAQSLRILAFLVSLRLFRWFKLLIHFRSLLFVLDFFRISFASIHRMAQAESVRAEADRHCSRPHSQGWR